MKQDFQKVSHSLANFIRLKDEAKSGKPLKRRREQDQHTEDRPENYKQNSARNPRHAASNAADVGHRHDKQLTSIKRLQNEPDVDYLRRVNRLTQASIRESQFEAKYGVEVVRNEQTGEIKIKKRPTDELEEQMKAAMKARQRGEVDEDGKPTSKKKRVPEKKMSKDEKRRLVKEMMAKKREEKAAAVPKVAEFKRDDVAFGEVTHGPPTLVTPRRAQKAETVPRVSLLDLRRNVRAYVLDLIQNMIPPQPGTKKSLLLHSVLDPKTVENSDDEDSVSVDEPKAPKTQKNGVIDLKGKRKELPAATRQMIEKQQQNVMDMYRQLKKTNRLNNVEM